MKISFRDGHNVVGPMDSEIANLHHEIQTIQEASTERGKELDRLTTGLSMDSPTDAEETVLCQETTNDLIKEADRTSVALKAQNQRLIKSTELLTKEIEKQQKIHCDSVETISKNTPPNVFLSNSLRLQALSTSATELVHTGFFAKSSKLQDIDSFDIAVQRAADVNAKNNYGRSPMDYATEHMFADGVKILIRHGAKSADAFLYALHMDWPDAAKMLVIITGQLASCSEIFSGLSEDKLIGQLDLSSANLTKDSVAYLSEVLTLNECLTVLNLSNNNVGPLGSAALAKMLTVNATISALDLSRINMGYEGVARIVSALESNNTVRVLNIADNNIEEEGAIIVAKLIGKNKSLTDLDLSCNNIKDLGAAYVLDGLSRNQSIMRINFSGNNITDELAEDIVEVLGKQSSVLAFAIESNLFSQSQAEVIESAKCTNTENNLQSLLTIYDLVDDVHSIELLAEMQQNDYLE